MVKSEYRLRLRGRWLKAFTLSPGNARLFRNMELTFFNTILMDGHNKLDNRLKERRASWLATPTLVFGDVMADWHYILYHVLEDELHHRGQIAYLIKRLPERLQPNTSTAAFNATALI